MNYLLIAVLIFLLGCAGKKDANIAFIPGTYVHSASGEFSKVWDTLTILTTGEPSNQYVINRRATYVDFRGVPKLQVKKEVWACLYKENDKVLFELKDGKVITLLLEQNALRVGKSQYEKIK